MDELTEFFLALSVFLALRIICGLAHISAYQHEGLCPCRYPLYPNGPARTGEFMGDAAPRGPRSPLFSRVTSSPMMASKWSVTFGLPYRSPLVISMPP